MIKYIGIVDRGLHVPLGLAWSPDGEMIAICGTEGVSLYSGSLEKIASLKMPHTREFLWRQCNSVAWNTDGKQLVAGSSFGVVLIWDVISQRIIRRLDTNISFVESTRWKPDETTIACSGDKGIVQIWKTTTGQAFTTLGKPYRTTLWERLFRFVKDSKPMDFKSTAVWSPNGSKLARFTPDRCIQLWDGHSYKLLHTLKEHTNQPLSLCWSPDSTQIASGGLDRTVIIWDVATGLSLKSWKATTDIQTIDWSSDGKKLAAVTRSVIGRADLYKPTITVWDADTGEVINTVENHLTGITELAWSPDGTKVAAIDTECIVEIWEL